ncbi:hypothetical protein Dd703_3693 [Musicola paradisiaca Ech703]|uniref:Uncharacterized protein n=1 Tax=Musicola paradisiaca (strain Ech703) TaxID=579405 RepID=C6C4P3_MUSP7|nr:hypothetical protein Dd703_3693 [Musicola paradisiaca Ech703]
MPCQYELSASVEHQHDFCHCMLLPLYELWLFRHSVLENASSFVRYARMLTTTAQ